MFSQIAISTEELTNFGWHGVQLFFHDELRDPCCSRGTRRSQGQNERHQLLAGRFFRIARCTTSRTVLFHFRTAVNRLDGVQLLPRSPSSTHGIAVEPTVADRWMPFPAAGASASSHVLSAIPADPRLDPYDARAIMFIVARWPSPMWQTR